MSLMKYSVRVKFHKSFIEIKGGEIVIGVTSAPEKGKANKEITERIAEHFGVPKSAVRIVSGASSRKKIIEIV